MSLKTIRLALIGFGNVGQSLVQILQAQAQSLAQNDNLQTEVVAVATLHHGSLYHPDGLDPQALLDAIGSRNLKHYPAQPGLVRGMDSLATIRKSNADCVIEMT